MIFGTNIPKQILGCAILAFTILATSPIALADQTDLIVKIERLATLEGDEYAALADSVTDLIKADTAAAIEAILPRLHSENIDEKLLTIYLSGLALINSPRVVDVLCRLSSEANSATIRKSCRAALVNIDLAESSDCLLSMLGYISDANERFLIIDALAQRKSAAVLPYTAEILRSDVNEYYWRPIFVFGKLGDLAVPFLMTKVNDHHLNVRFNAINVLGQWLMAPEADSTLREQFYRENDKHVRILLLSSIENMCTNLKSTREFMKQAASKTDDDEAKEFANEASDLIKTMSDEMEAFRALKAVSSAEFDQAYSRAWDSYGRDADYDLLFRVSGASDEQKLKALRERILQRNSDESFIDYKHISEIIHLNRIVFGKQN